jgi:hypothetical protein
MLRIPLPFRSVLGVATLLVGCTNIAVAQVSVPPPMRPAAAADPVSAAVTEASRRFGVPESWIRSVMRVESAGDVDAVSRAGAMGLMQVMPTTYAELRARHGLGADPFAVRDNILAGTAYLREMFDRYGATGMLAAYNAGPGRWEEHVARGRPLPGETIGYLARLGPTIGIDAAAMPSVRIAPTAPSPFASPIFVAMNVAVIASGGSAAVSANGPGAVTTAAVEPIENGLFARRHTAQTAAASAPSSASSTADDMPRASSQDTSASTLFAVRGDRGER